MARDLRSGTLWRTVAATEVASCWRRLAHRTWHARTSAHRHSRLDRHSRLSLSRRHQGNVRSKSADRSRPTPRTGRRSAASIDFVLVAKHPQERLQSLMLAALAWSSPATLAPLAFASELGPRTTASRFLACRAVDSVSNAPSVVRRSSEPHDAFELSHSTPSPNRLGHVHDIDLAVFQLPAERAASVSRSFSSVPSRRTLLSSLLRSAFF